jgi:hypothetical protein
MNDNDVRKLVREAFPPPAGIGAGSDLWPRMWRELDRRRISWFDWVLAAAGASWLVVFPQTIPALLYHL